MNSNSAFVLNWRFLAIAIVSSTLLMLPMWWVFFTGVLLSDDLIYYATTLHTFSNQFWAGNEWYPRWIMAMNEGFGAPIFLFNPPLPYFLTVGFQWLSEGDPNGIGRVFLSLHLAVIVAACTSSMWLRCISLDQKNVPFLAVLYACFPVSIMMVYLATNIAQLWALAWFPLLFFAAYHVQIRGWSFVPVFACSYALLAFTHLPSFMMMAPVPVMYAALTVPKGKRFGMFVKALCALCLGCAMAAIYIVPALTNREFMTEEGFTAGKYYYANNFLNIWTSKGIEIIAGFVILYTLARVRGCFLQDIRRGWFWILMLCGALCMMMPISLPIWQTIHPLQSLQFPHRFMVITVPALVAFLASVHIHWRRFVPASILFILLFAVFVSRIAFQEGYMANSSVVEDFLAKQHQENMTVFASHATRWMTDNSISIERLPDWVKHVPEAEVKGRGNAVVVHNEERQIDIQMDITSPHAQVVLRRFYFPEWSVDNPAVIVTHNRGLLAVDVEQGKRVVSLRMPFYIGEKLGLWCSSIATLVCVLWSLVAYVHRRK
jgi:hypothetical protein